MEAYMQVRERGNAMRRENVTVENTFNVRKWKSLKQGNQASMPASTRGHLQDFASQTGLTTSSLSSDSVIISESAPLSLSDGQDVNSPMDNSAVPPYRPVRYQLPGALNALSSSPDGEYAVVAGREVLKVLHVTTQEATEYINLRTGSNLSLNYSSNDVKWGNNGTRNKIATAATNGAIIIWDLNKTGRKTDRVISEHTRAVNRVCFQPNNGYVLLSASQDGNIKAWDLRDPKAAAKYSYEGKSESVRDVQFNPLNTNEFAAGFETGTIQKWDMRNPKLIYERKVSAHNGPCLTVDWHPDGRTLASGGRDRTIKVWDMTSDSRKPQYTIRTMASVSRIQWRPGYDNEIASCALLSDNGLHIWDVRRPNIAKYTFDEHSTTPTGKTCRFQWLSPDVVISCAKDRFFMRHEIVGAYQPIELLRKNGIGWNIHGDLVFSIDKSTGDSFVDEISTPGLSNVIARKQRRARTTTGEELPLQYIPPQTCGIAHLPLFDYETFSVLAQNYIISGEDLKTACETNAKIAWSMQRFRAAQTWKIVQLLFSDMDEDNKSLSTTDEGVKKDIEDNQLRNGNDMASESESETSQKQTTDEEKDNDELSSASSESNELPNISQNQEIVSDLFAYYTEQSDVQTCVTLFLVIQQYIHVGSEQLEDWFSSYIDLLHRFKLWTSATDIINACPIERVRTINMNATTINIACNNCFKLVLGTARASWACDKCHKLLNSCSICHQTVRGLYVWCQGCNHGGHLEHMRDWFSSKSQCPTGCGHNCTLDMS